MRWAGFIERMSGCILKEQKARDGHKCNLAEVRADWQALANTAVPHQPRNKQTN
jgi:hypothetical protein